MRPQDDSRCNGTPGLEDALLLAAEAHRGQVYPSQTGEPYILHPLRVMLRLESETERVAALLHDVVEDTPTTLTDLRRLGYPDDVVAAVDRLTRRDGETYEAYIERIAGDPLARRVKLADLADNLDNNRRLEPAPAVRERIARYERGQARLRGD
ncbi:MAG: HD domain-containing protein [Chloroflexota bacterium]|nr:HD domain-containing protein [Chloroflexota bacterium]